MQNILYWNERPEKRIRKIENALKKDPFLYHKKKNVISSRFNDSNNNDGQNTNQELLFCQDENIKEINTLKNKINEKSSTIENNAQNYLNYMIKEKNFNTINKIPTEPGSPKNNSYQRTHNQINNNLYNQNITPNKYSLNKSNNRVYRNNNNIFDSINFNNNINELNSGNRMIGSSSYKNIVNNHLLNNENVNNVDFAKNRNNSSSNYLPIIHSLKGTTDITDNNYYDKISKQLILQMNKNYMGYNQNLINQRYSPNNGNKLLFLRNNKHNKLSLPPGHISNPKYYNLGESKLKSNPIVYPGNRAPIFNHYNNHNHRLKSEFI